VPSAVAAAPGQPSFAVLHEPISLAAAVVVAAALGAAAVVSAAWLAVLQLASVGHAAAVAAAVLEVAVVAVVWPAVADSYLLDLDLGLVPVRRSYQAVTFEVTSEVTSEEGEACWISVLQVLEGEVRGSQSGCWGTRAVGAGR